ncbi:hypothetical protein ScPMuIL_011742 [Solemya velum]
MAEAHSAVAFSFSVSPDGVNVNLDHEALWQVWHSGLRSWKKRIGRFKNRMKNGIYPSTPVSWLIVTSLLTGLHIGGVDISLGLIDFIQEHSPIVKSLPDIVGEASSCLIFSTTCWILKINIRKYLLKALLSYQQWMYEVRGPKSTTTKVWFALMKVLGGQKPLLMSYQASLPNLAVPSLQQTTERYLKSVRPLLDDEKYARMEKLSEEFRNGLGKKFQRYLQLKSWWATNYVSDWWEEYVYLRGRSPIMVNSNFYGLDAVLIKPSNVQVARAANIIHSMLTYRRELERESLQPLLLNKTIPLCSAQYERQFNTIRIPGLETDHLVHYKDSKHIAVYHKGRFYKVYVHLRGRLLKPCEIEVMLQRILDDDSPALDGEKHLAALTAGDRVPWAKARLEFFSKGKNKASLDAVEKAAFFLSLDDEPQDYDPEDPSKLNAFGRSMLHGKGYDRWFDKSFTLVVCSNGRIGFNGEHSWADAPVMAHLWEYVICEDCFTLGYDENGHTKGQPEMQPPNPIRLEWEISKPLLQVIDTSLEVANQLLNDVSLHLLMHDAFGKGFIKTCKMSPDAFIQMALQLAYYRDSNKFCLTYESSMTRLYREGRTETVRSCTVESTAFVRAMENKGKTDRERIACLREAVEIHQSGYRDAMTGKGIDRHLFCLYVVSKYLNQDSSFLAEVLSEPWRLSTSQTPHSQTDKLDLTRNPDHISVGGGFGPVADDGYGVSYIIAGENVLFFHISSKVSCHLTNSERFAGHVRKALSDMRNLFHSD